MFRWLRSMGLEWLLPPPPLACLLLALEMFASSTFYSLQNPQMEAIADFFMIYGAPMSIFIIIKVEIVPCSLSGHKDPPSYLDWWDLHVVCTMDHEVAPRSCVIGCWTCFGMTSVYTKDTNVRVTMEFEDPIRHVSRPTLSIGMDGPMGFCGGKGKEML